jgi:hypothetical protein
MWVRIALVAALGVSTAGCTTIQTLKPTSPMPVTFEMAEIIVAGVQRSLKDPRSAMFGETRAGRSPDGFIVVCGLVNAKNSFGGYTGTQMYYGLLQKDVFVVIDFASDEGSTYAVTTQCRSAGLIS